MVRLVNILSVYIVLVVNNAINPTYSVCSMGKQMISIYRPVISLAIWPLGSKTARAAKAKAKKKAETWEVDGLQHFICHRFLMCSLFSLVLNKFI